MIPYFPCVFIRPLLKSESGVEITDTVQQSISSGRGGVPRTRTLSETRFFTAGLGEK